MIGRPETLVEVKAWAEALRAERPTSTGRAMVDALEKVAVTFFTTTDPQFVAQLGNTLDKLLRAIAVADLGIARAETRRLRGLADRQEHTAGRLKGMH